VRLRSLSDGYFGDEPQGDASDIAEWSILLRQ
jgi:hypothetical protein